MKILIIKTGAAGDVVRTTSILNILEGNVYWHVDEKFRTLLPAYIKPYEEGINYDLVISLEEDQECAKLASSIQCDKLIGVYWNNGKVNYTDDSAGWFDMSLISRFGNERANELKMRNSLPFQHYLFNLIGKSFSAERYKISSPVYERKSIVGIEKRAGSVWPNKAWGGYDDLATRLKSSGHKVRFFEQRQNLSDYLKDIAECSLVISGDTLAMHLALAFEIPCVAIFNCTSPDEIFDYGLLKKVVSPMLHKNFYSRAYSGEVVNSISVETVMDAVLSVSLR